MAIFLNTTINDLKSQDNEEDDENLSPLSPPLSPISSSLFAEAFTDDIALSRYDNVRPQSQFSTNASNTYNSELREPRHSVTSILDDGSAITQMLPRVGQNSARYQSVRHHPKPPHRTNSEKDKDNGNGDSANEKNKSYIPATTFAKLKYYYDHSPVRHFAPFLLLALYSVIGAYLFYLVEHDYEKELVKEVFYRFEKDFLRIKLPENLEWDMWGAIFYVGTVFTTIGYGNITPRTTKGQAMSIIYAIIGIPLVLAILNQVSKKMTVYLSEKWIKYREHVRFEKLKELKRRKLSRQRKEDVNVDIEANIMNKSTTAILDKDSMTDEEEENPIESRTIPIWVALSLCIGYICLIAALFCIWETRWTYFNSFYFICISCLTIGLGDIVPDHPHMLILMFVFVIFGLSIVSMLISVIQIKMEEWLYRMLIKLQKEYQKALENGDVMESEHLMLEAMKNEPWYIRNLATMCMSDKQASLLDKKAETFERVLSVVNNKTVQTDDFDDYCERNVNKVKNMDTTGQISIGGPSAPDEAQENVKFQKYAADVNNMREMGTDVISSLQSSSSDDDEMISAVDYMVIGNAPKEDSAALLAKASKMEEKQMAFLHVSVGSIDSVSEATSLPMDPIGSLVTADHSVQANAFSVNDRSMQTDLRNCHLEEMISRANDEAAVKKPETLDGFTDPEPSPICFDKCIKTDSVSIDSKAVQIELRNDVQDRCVMTDERVLETQATATDVMALMNRSVDATSLVGDVWLGGECSRSVQTVFPDEECSVERRLGVISVIPDLALLSPAATMECDVSTMEDDGGSSADAKRRRFSNSKREVFSFKGTPLNEMSVQCSLTCDTCDIGVQTLPVDSELFLVTAGSRLPLTMVDQQDAASSPHNISRSDSVIVLTGTEGDGQAPHPKPVKHDLVIQTDDSYLRIARRLNEYRTIRTQTLNIYSAPFSTSTDESPTGGLSPGSPHSPQTPDSPSRRTVCFQQEEADCDPLDNAAEGDHHCWVEKRNSKRKGGFLQPAAERIRQSFRRRKGHSERAEKSRAHHHSAEPRLRVTQQSQQLFQPYAAEEPLIRKWSRPSNSQMEPRPLFPTTMGAQTAAGSRVMDYVAKHERGIHNPGMPVGQHNMVTVVDMRKEQQQHQQQ